MARSASALLTAVLALSACRGTPAAAPSEPPTKSEATPSATASAASTPTTATTAATTEPPPHPQVQPPFACRKDADCVPPTCGPCEAGTVLVQQSRQCAANPCPGVKVACSPQQVCVVR